MSKDIGFCSITEDICRKEGECEKCSLKHIHENIEHYAKLHEANRLIELPCAVGDTAHFITVNAEGEYIIGSGKFSYSWLDYPRMIYATKEEAEANLAELKGE